MPALAIEIAGQEATLIVLEQRIDPDGLCAGEMIQNDLIGKRKVFPRLLFLDCVPLVRAGRGISLLPGIVAFPALGIDVVAAFEDAAEQLNFLIG